MAESGVSDSDAPNPQCPSSLFPATLPSQPQPPQSPQVSEPRATGLSIRPQKRTKVQCLVLGAAGKEKLGLERIAIVQELSQGISFQALGRRQL